MNDCCNNATCSDYPKKTVCPVNGQTYLRIARKTLLHYLRKPWQHTLPEQAYYFCDSPDCDVVYFGQDKQTFTQTDRTACYCFDVRHNNATGQTELSRDFVIERTRDGSCDCNIRNPSRCCCRKDFRKNQP